MIVQLNGTLGCWRDVSYARRSPCPQLITYDRRVSVLDNDDGSLQEVAVSNLPNWLMETKADFAGSGLTVMIVGHVGDGNFHLGIMYDPDNQQEPEKAEGLAFRVSRRATAMRGTCSSEHGIGWHKTVHMATEHGTRVDVMKSNKTALDPNDTMNRGKMYPS